MALKVDMRQRYVAAMVLSGVGDAIGYKNGNWEFCHSGEAIHRELKDLGGIAKLKVKLPEWPVSDDTVMHLATAEGLMASGREEDKEKVYALIAREYKVCWSDMGGRAPGMTCAGGVHRLKPGMKNGYCIPFDKRGGGCGAAMRAMCIGLRYSKPEEEHELIRLSVETGRMTHHHPTGYLGALAAALFTSYAIQNVPVIKWGAKLLDILPRALEYVKSRGQFVRENVESWAYFHTAWTKYLKLRGIVDGESEPTFPEKYGVKERDAFYKSRSYSGWGGSSGHDAPMIAYDALLSFGGSSWAELCSRSMLHSGDSDSTGVIAACCYGAMFGFTGVPECNYKKLEYRERLVKAGTFFFEYASGVDKPPPTETRVLVLPAVPESEEADNVTEEVNDWDIDNPTSSATLEATKSCSFDRGDDYSEFDTDHSQATTYNSDSEFDDTKHSPVKRDSAMSQESYNSDSDYDIQEKQRKLTGDM